MSASTAMDWKRTKGTTFAIVVVVVVSLLMLCTLANAESELKELTITHKVFFDMTIDSREVGRIIIGLFGDIVPKTVENFVRLAASKQKNRSYRGSVIHRVMKGTGIIGGDFVAGDGTGAYSIHGGKHFADENFRIKHTSPGIVSMASHGEHQNGCQFLISTIETPWLDNKKVAFGKVLKGMDIVYRTGDILPDARGRPIVDVKIVKSGKLNLKKPYLIPVYDDEDDFNELEFETTTEIDQKTINDENGDQPKLKGIHATPEKEL